MWEGKMMWAILLEEKYFFKKKSFLYSQEYTLNLYLQFPEVLWTFFAKQYSLQRTTESIALQANFWTLYEASIIILPLQKGKKQ